MEFQFDEPPAPPTTVVDSREAVYTLAAMLGEGGQGAVYRTPDNRIAVKLIFEREVREAADLKRRLERLESRPLWQWPLSRPLGILKPASDKDGGHFIGYVMDLRENTEPISTLIAPTRFLPDWRQIYDWYNATGGLRRRLVLLARAAETLAWLNGLPFVYADPSPNNILIPTDVASEDVWLIDPDNIGLAGAADASEASGTPRALGTYTEGYAAPEVIGGKRPVTTLSDRFAFAVIAFQVLTTRHPYVGDGIDRGPPEMLAEAFAGEWPWVDDPADRRNACQAGIRPRALVLNSGLRKVAQETFGPGRDEPSSRPGLGRWADQLWRAADRTLRCRKCGATHYVVASDPVHSDDPTRDRPVAHCPWCSHPCERFATMEIRTWVAPFDIKAGDRRWPGGIPAGQQSLYVAVVSHSGFLVTRRHALSGSLMDRHDTVLDISYASDGLRLRPGTSGCPIFVERAGPWEDVTGPLRLRWTAVDGTEQIGPIHFGPPDEDHRVARFVHSPTP